MSNSQTVSHKQDWLLNIECEVSQAAFLPDNKRYHHNNSLKAAVTQPVDDCLDTEWVVLADAEVIHVDLPIHRAQGEHCAHLRGPRSVRNLVTRYDLIGFLPFETFFSLQYDVLFFPT